MRHLLSATLVRLADTVGSAHSLADIYEAALAAVRDVGGVDRASILLFDRDGVMRFKAWSGLSEAYRAAVEGHSPWTPGTPPPDPIVVSDVRQDGSLRQYGSVFEDEHIRALAFIPIVSRGRVIGKFMLYRSEPDAFASGELDDAVAIGRLIGLAVDRIRRDEEARDVHQRTLFALDAAQMGTWEWDIGRNTVLWSDNLERIHGLPPGTFTGEFASYEREIHPDDRPRVLSSLRRALADGAAHDVEYRIVGPDGTVRWVQGKGRVETDASGRAIRMSGVCMDISARKHAESEIAEALRQEAQLRERLSRLTTGAHRLLTSVAAGSLIDEIVALAGSVVTADGYAVWRREGDEWRVAASTGVSAEFAGTVLRHDGRLSFDAPIIAEDVAKTAILDLRRTQYAREGIAALVSIPLAIRGAPAGSIVFYYRTPHRPSELELHVAVALGQLAAAAIANADLYAEQQRLRRDAEDAEMRAAFLAEASAVLSSLDYQRNLQRLAELAVPTLSDWCAVDLLNDRGDVDRLAVTHRDPSKVAWALELHRRYPPRVADGTGVAQVLRTGTALLYADISDEMLVAAARDAEHLRIMRELQLQSAMILPLTAGRRTFGAITFVTTTGGRRLSQADLDFGTELARRAALAIENARLFAEAREANRLKDEFLATLSHELRTPLNVILGRARRLTDSITATDALRQNAETIERNAQSLNRLVEDLLDVSRFTVGQVTLNVKPLDLAAIVQTVTAGLEPGARAKGLTLESDCDGGVPLVPGDPTRLQQVVWNLLTNAIKFTNPGGRVRVAVRRTATGIALTVSDTGRGIASEFLPHVFDMFRQGEPPNSREHGGLGLGLSIVRRLVELHGGTVTARSDGIGLGSTFEVELPCTQDQLSTAGSVG
jgi:PAS domain S-box-containing protein